MKVTLTKNIGKYKAGDEVEVSESRKNYWEKIGVIGEKIEVQPVIEKPMIKATQKAGKPDTKKNQKFTGIEKVKKEK